MKNNGSSPLAGICWSALSFLICFATLATPQQAFAASSPSLAAAMPQTSEPPMSEVGPHVDAILGKSTLVRLPAPITRISVGNPLVADVVLINPREIYLLGKSIGSTNVILWTKSGQATIVDVTVAMDTAALQDRLNQLLPGEKNIKVSASADTVVLSGRISDAVKASQAVELADTYSRTLAGASTGASGPMNGGSAANKTVNLLQLNDPQQVMLEVKVAEISKTLLDKLGVKFSNGHVTGSGWTYTLLSDFLFGNLGGFAQYSKGLNSLQLDAQRENGLVRLLAEPTIMAISGQKGSFLAGGKVFIPVARNNDVAGTTTITLEEKEFGVGLTFTPTVLDGGRINLNVVPEVSELNQTGSPFISANGITSILPSFSVRRAATTVQLNDGQSFAIAGLIKNNVSETVKAFPVLGEIPILGALFRSSEFQNDKTELLFIVTPRLVKPLPPDYKLPTDNFIEPTRAEFFLGGKMEGSPQEPQPAAKVAKPTDSAPPQQANPGGFEMETK